MLRTPRLSASREGVAKEVRPWAAAIPASDGSTPVVSLRYHRKTMCPERNLESDRLTDGQPASSFIPSQLFERNQRRGEDREKESPLGAKTRRRCSSSTCLLFLFFFFTSR
ncbi:hypothetical protein IMZ48_21795 [Candidatus Bathyarchaeota archaeon]|nr:hypothetical protein [Candidatus Bathyarchaeota archaeon]